MHVGVDGPVAGGVAGVGQAGVGAAAPLLGDDHGRLVPFRPIGQLGDAGDERAAAGLEDGRRRGRGPARAVADDHNGQRQKGEHHEGQRAHADKAGEGAPPRDDTAHR